MRPITRSEVVASWHWNKRVHLPEAYTACSAWPAANTNDASAATFNMSHSRSLRLQCNVLCGCIEGLRISVDAQMLQSVSARRADGKYDGTLSGCR